MKTLSLGPVEEFAIGSSQEEQADRGVKEDEEVVLNKTERRELAFIARKENDPERDGDCAHRAGRCSAKEDDREIAKHLTVARLDTKEV